MDARQRVAALLREASPEARAIMTEVFRLERENIDLKAPRIKAELVSVIKDHIR